ncbi:putative ABC transport system ATP-binding protein [Bacilli bacterium PM5-3]|nr:putative ABC transport system ATP-binding protein [Bacilli bacterium PM5-3]
MIKLENICKVFNASKSNEVTVLNDINLNIKHGEYIAIIGKSGSGKSTLLNIIGKLDEITSGKYYFEGKDFSCSKDKQNAKFRTDNIGFIFQDFALLENETVKSNILIPTLFNKNKQNNFEELVKLLSIDKIVNKKCSKLSGGEKQRVAIARALINRPQLIIADEPTGSLDQENAIIVMDILSNLNNLGHTIIVVTHDLDVAKKASKIIKLNDGKIID